MAPFYWSGSTASGLQIHYEETVYYWPLNSQKFLVPIWSTSVGGKVKSTLEPPSGFESRIFGLGIQRYATRPLLHKTRRRRPKYYFLLWQEFNKNNWPTVKIRLTVVYRNTYYSLLFETIFSFNFKLPLSWRYNQNCAKIKSTLKFYITLR